LIVKQILLIHRVNLIVQPILMTQNANHHNVIEQQKTVRQLIVLKTLMIHRVNLIALQCPAVIGIS
jgi:hypothetical protein